MGAGSPLGGMGANSVLTSRSQLTTVSPRAGGGQLAAGTIVNRVKVPGPRQVLLKVKIAELNRTAIREFGANFQAEIGNNTITSLVCALNQPQSQIFGVFDSGRFTMFLNALRQNNLARILAEPNLVAMDGQPARFLAGGSFPFPVPQAGVNGANVITIEFRDFGAILQFIPHIIDEDAIRLDVEPSFSELNFGAGTAVQGTTVPGINQRSARTVVELREGQTLAIAGLLSTRTNAVTTRIPLLGDAPIIGPFFSRNRIETLETELVVLVTPELVDPLEASEVPLSPGDWYKEPNDCEFYLLGRIEGRTGEPFRSTIHELDPFHMMKHYKSEQQWVVGPHGHGE
jgi:pilus assembly protein CpaC